MSVDTLIKMESYIEDIKSIVGELTKEEELLYLKDEGYSDGMVQAYVTTFHTANPMR